jgi:hypothetical protein
MAIVTPKRSCIAPILPHFGIWTKLSRFVIVILSHKEMIMKAQKTYSLNKRLYNIHEAAQYLGRSVWALREMYYHGKYPVFETVGECYLTS